MNSLRKFFSKKLNLEEQDGPDKKIFENLTFDGLCEHWKSKGFKNIITMASAGINTSTVTPDFRFPNSGLYDYLQKLHLPHLHAKFGLNYFNINPNPFFALAKELFPVSFIPTPSHYFVKLLHEKGLLLRHYTQNVDALERIAQIPDDKLVEVYGTFFSNHCLGCGKFYSMEWMRKEIHTVSVPKCTDCKAIVKPDIVVCGENLPEKFYELPATDFSKCDLLIILGSSLELQPFASLIDRANPKCVRLLINPNKVDNTLGGQSSWFTTGPSLMFGKPKNIRDIAFIGECDAGCMAIAEALGWRTELNELIKTEQERLNKKFPIKQADVKVDKKRKVKAQKVKGTK